tara:strand:- start:230 stop:343 length:114 start_codon:yes stop_codon:yes gene_type:complete
MVYMLSIGVFNILVGGVPAKLLKGSVSGIRKENKKQW